MPEMTEAQANLMRRMRDTPGALRCDDEASPSWWVEGSFPVRPNVARAVISKGWAALTHHWGGWPGIEGFTVTDAGRAALAKADAEEGRG